MNTSDIIVGLFTIQVSHPGNLLIIGFVGCDIFLPCEGSRIWILLNHLNWKLLIN